MDENLRDEFLAEAQEIVEALSRDLLILDRAHKDDDELEHDRLNEVFRGVHTLKGLSSMFGFPQIGTIAHVLEDLLDDLRLGKVIANADIFDVLFDGVELFQRLLVETSTGEDASDLSLFAEAIERVSTPNAPDAARPTGAYDIDTNILAVLTEYEEHRLNHNAEAGATLMRWTVEFPLESIDTDLDIVRERAKPVCEIITYLPSMESDRDDAIVLEVLLATTNDVATLRGALGDTGTLEELPRSTVARESINPDRPAPPSKESRSDIAIERSVRAVADTVRVDIRKLDNLMNLVGELALVRGAVTRMTEALRARGVGRDLVFEILRINRSFERRLRELQDGILDVRMVPLRHVFDRLARVVRQVARENKKEVHLAVSGAETEIDKLIIEELSDPLLHIIRNAIDHGIEDVRRRELAGKPTTGTLVLNAYQKGNRVVIEIEDDGAGIDKAKLISRAVSAGRITAQEANELSEEETLALVFQPGISTQNSVTEISGRGVGMDVVKTNISRLGGIVEIHTELGIGTTFTLTLPATLAIIRALVVRVAGHIYALPITTVSEAIVLDANRVRTIESRDMLDLRDATIPLCYLDDLFEHESDRSGRRYVVVVVVGTKRVGFVVDGLDGQQDVVIRALGKSLANVRGFAGATDLGDQRVALVLDTPGLVEEVFRASPTPRLEASA